MNFTEIEKLHTMLIEAHIPHTFMPLWDGKQIRIFADSQMKEELDDCVIHRYSHGYEHGLLESYNLNYCNGFETAEEIFEGWQKMYLDKNPKL